jgi:hypothetical protein
MAYGDSVRTEFVEVCGCLLQSFPHSQLHGQHVGCTTRENGEGHVGVHHPFYDFIDSAVAARGYDQIRALADLVARKVARYARARGGSHAHVVSLFRQDLDGPLDQRTSASSESARSGIVDEDGILVGDWQVLRFPR